MYCPGCGNQIAMGATYCSQCGRPAMPSGASEGQRFQQAVAQTSSGLAIGALIMSLVFPVVGLIMGYLAKKEIRNANGRLSGDGLATAAIVIGWIFTIFGAILIVIGIGALISTANYYY